MSEALRKLAAKVVRSEVEKRKPADLDAVAALVTFEVTGTGDIVATFEGGGRRVGRGDDFTQSIAERLDEIATERPEFFGGKASKSSVDPSNPFVKGPAFSVTEQMLLFRTDPERAEYLAAEAGLTIKPIR